MAQLHISLPHLTHNYHQIRRQLQPETKLIGVVKANGYGSESATIASHLEFLGVERLAVAYASEGVALRKARIRIPIMVFYPQPKGLDAIISANLEPVLYSQSIFNAFNALVQSHGHKDYPVHIKYNTGLNRIGFSVAEKEWVVNALKKKCLGCTKCLFSFSRNGRPTTIPYLRPTN